MTEQFKCAYCEEIMPYEESYTFFTIHPDTFGIGGHKGCMNVLNNHYKRTGIIMTKKDVESVHFDTSI